MGCSVGAAEKCRRIGRALAVGLALAACQPAPGDCTSSAACPPNSICVVGVCRLACNSSEVCAAGEFCRDGYCAPGLPRDGGDGEAGARPDTAVADRPSTDNVRSDRAELPDSAGPDRASTTDAGSVDRTGSDALISDNGSADRATHDRATGDGATGDHATVDHAAVDSAPIDSSRPYCGDGDINVAGEQCDDHNNVTEGCQYGLQSCQVCDEHCQWVAGATSWCGDGQVDPTYERCDGSWDCTRECTPCGNPEALDQSLLDCASPPVTQCADSFVLFQGQSAAQSFTAGISGALTSVWLYGRNDAFTTNPVQVSIVDAQARHDSLLITGFSIAANTLASAQVAWSASNGWNELVFAQPAIMTAGSIYYIVLQLVGDVTPSCPPLCWDDVMLRCDCQPYAHWGLYNDWQGAQLDSYPAGYAFYCGGDCSTWAQEPSYRDHEFRVMITPQCM